MARFASSEDVRYRQVDGCGVILDLRNQRYRVLDHLASEMWACLTGEGERAAYIERWTHEYAVSVEAVLSTLDDFSAHCLEKGLLCREPEAEHRFSQAFAGPPSWYRRIPAGLLAFAALTLTALSLRFRGFSKTYGRRREICANSQARSVSCLEAVVGSFLGAENFVFFSRAPNDCLARSLALFRYLRWRGIPATHIIGIRRIPFAAHAWVEVAGVGVLAPRPRGFSALATLTQ